jgi:hypothetical protein
MGSLDNIYFNNFDNQFQITLKLKKKTYRLIVFQISCDLGVISYFIKDHKKCMTILTFKCYEL